MRSLEALHGACCPITQEVFVDPVMCADGHSYERAALVRWLQQSACSPMTGMPLATTHVVPNYALRKLIDALGTDFARLGSISTAQSRTILRPMAERVFTRALVWRAVVGILLVATFRLPDLDVLIALAMHGGDVGAAVVLGGGIVLVGLGIGCQQETLAFTALIAGLPLSALSFSYGMLSGMGSATGGELILVWVLLLAGTTVCAIGVYLSHLFSIERGEAKPH
mmetsp:Transcript_16006/g.34768  ORF Transcript_16006/g.34768 Transcript_16006/m.34768 type:complete len:225 (-) Transcript_16006:397-1071(-)|eukprot:CAMPEP_0183353422 /NCGR_PEP_ID=MMETSP0164_2-20130417/33244_1 /TAXON_ID=221442 /ORGANISM="Coccolithus pelagicus ssp braarudi, Strain PLY182g" /LENGTH=224 /DNA_ID=CAMNT_0025526091 /DNA_START=40 /DNA_END=714 /DNA_ORIENTATION=-